MWFLQGTHSGKVERENRGVGAGSKPAQYIVGVGAGSKPVQSVVERR